jgi:protein-tyrosine phosphatase
MMKAVLFLCSANYYRSRFAEHLFNELAGQSGLPWRAISRGLLVGKWGDGGPISSAAVEALKSRGIELDGDQRHPKPLSHGDLANSSLVVAMKECEHRPLLSEQFPEWADLVEYWHIDDVDCAEPHEALPLLEGRVRDLVACLAETIEPPGELVAVEPPEKRARRWNGAGPAADFVGGPHRRHEPAVRLRSA